MARIRWGVRKGEEGQDAMVTTETPRGRDDEWRAPRPRAQTQGRPPRAPRAPRARYLGVAVAALLLLLGGGGFLAFAHGSNNRDSANSANSSAGIKAASASLPNLAPGAAVDGISCQEENVTYHIHVALTLYRDGQAVALPAGIGHAILSGQRGCLYWLHTHSFDNAAGIVHIESPTKRIYTLGQALDIWRYAAQWGAWNDDGSAITVDGSFVNRLRAAPQKSVHVYVDGKLVGPGSYRGISLTAHKSITIELGAPLRKPAARVAFPPGE